MTDIITRGAVAETMAAVLEEYGTDHTYPGAGEMEATCHYRWDTDDVERGLATTEQVGQPACVIGVLMDKWGILDDLVPYIYDHYPDNAKNADTVLSEEATGEAAALMFRLQCGQDKGLTWGDAWALAQDTDAWMAAQDEGFDPDVVRELLSRTA